MDFINNQFKQYIDHQLQVINQSMIKRVCDLRYCKINPEILLIYSLIISDISPQEKIDLAFQLWYIYDQELPHAPQATILFQDLICLLVWKDKLNIPNTNDSITSIFSQIALHFRKNKNKLTINDYDALRRIISIYSIYPSINEKLFLLKNAYGILKKDQKLGELIKQLYNALRH